MIVAMLEYRGSLALTYPTWIRRKNCEVKGTFLMRFDLQVVDN